MNVFDQNSLDSTVARINERLAGAEKALTVAAIQTDKNAEKTEKRVHDLELAVVVLQNWRWWLVGVAAATGVFCGLVGFLVHK